MSSVLTARGVPGGTAAKTFDDAHRDEVSKSIWIAKAKTFSNVECKIWIEMTHVVNAI